MNVQTHAGKRVGAVLGLLLFISVVGIFVVQETYHSAAAPLSTETSANAPDVATPREEPRATPLSLMPPHREISDNGNSPTISFIDSPSATCTRPVPGTGACYIQWNYLYVTAASGSYVISMTVAIDNHIRAYHAGFFQTYMYIPGDMTAPGYQVTCGMPGSGGIADWGHQYSYVIRARDTANLSATNYGSITCPADTVRVFLPFIIK
ncbi:MAG: hypothetical protein IAF02_15785 [Anaerolineae bacterium]|nr:hypothetical protein [Anaerolineae bacterium]